MSTPTYIRIISKQRDPRGYEVIFPISSIWKIEVEYAVGNGPFYATDVQEGVKDPDAKRVYKLYVGGDVFTLPQNPNSAVLKVIEDIYKSAVKD